MPAEESKFDNQAFQLRHVTISHETSGALEKVCLTTSGRLTSLGPRQGRALLSYRARGARHPLGNELAAFPKPWLKLASRSLPSNSTFVLNSIFPTTNLSLTEIRVVARGGRTSGVPHVQSEAVRAIKKSVKYRRQGVHRGFRPARIVRKGGLRRGSPAQARSITRCCQCRKVR